MQAAQQRAHLTALLLDLPPTTETVRRVESASSSPQSADTRQTDRRAHGRARRYLSTMQYATDASLHPARAIAWPGPPSPREEAVCRALSALAALPSDAAAPGPVGPPGAAAVPYGRAGEWLR